MGRTRDWPCFRHTLITAKGGRGDMKNCVSCGSTLQERHGTYRFEPPANIPGGTMVIPDATWLECENCGQQMLPAELEERLERLSIQRQGLLSAAQIKAVRQKLGLTQTEMAERLGVGEKTYARWESGRSIQNKSSDNLIRLFPLPFWMDAATYWVILALGEAVLVGAAAYLWPGWRHRR